ncbi:MAG TPA: PKD domain-containing protein [Flavobacteriales bacterium]|nr:PKD domain-containing protein [Flavobacteriales bacterium]
MRIAIGVFFCLLLAASAQAQEVCDNGIDDDADGLIDLNDTTDCACINADVGGNGSLIPNPSFEDQDCIPVGFSELSCATGWEQATDATSDYMSTNGFYPAGLPPPANGIGVGGGWAQIGYQEYLGACLLSPMLQTETYSITFDIVEPTIFDGIPIQADIHPPVDITLFGLASCPSFPLNTSGCPESLGWTELGHVSYQPSWNWSQVTITFTPPFDVQAVILGSPCDMPPEFAGAPGYFLYDGLQLAERVDVHVIVQDTGSYCTNDRTLIAHPDTVAGDYQWYQGGVALVGRTDSILDLSLLGLGPADYQFRVSIGDTVCAIFTWPVEDDVPPVLHPTTASQDGCAPLLVNFTQTTDPDSIATVIWAFGDGDSSFVYAPSHTYTDAGIYDVTLSVVAPNGCTVDTTLADLIEVYPVPVASFTPDITEGCEGMVVQFTNNTGTLTSTCAWTFGDGGTSSDCDPQHTYTEAGHYDVRLTVTSPDGCVDDTLMQQLIFTHPAPDISFTVNPTEGCVPFDVLFINTTPAAQTDSVYWDFGQDSTSNDGVSTTTYTIPGVYDVYLSVTDAVGCGSDTTAVGLITAHGIPAPSFTFGPDSGCYPLEVAFVNTTDPNMTSTCAWDFGDGGTSTICDTAHIYTEPGLYGVTLAVTSTFGCVGDTTYPDIITVFDHPTAEFTFGPQPTDVFETEQFFVNTSSADAITWDWTFESADPDSSHATDPVVLFPGGDPGTYDVRLIVSNVHTCTDTAYAQVVIDGYFSVYVPNAFTPDGDGVNDGWRPIMKDLDPKSYMLRVFDRWGKIVWSSQSQDDRWDGRVSGSDPVLGVYAWKLDVRDAVGGYAHTFLGHVTVVR